MTKRTRRMGEVPLRFPARPAGDFELWARATDAQGRSQSPTVPFNNSGYLFGAIVRHPVVVR